MAYELLDRHSYQSFCDLLDAARLPYCTTIWHFGNCIGVAGTEVLFAAVEQQILQHGYLARGNQIIDATLVPAPKRHFTRED
jgi:IS5 family transposase